MLDPKVIAGYLHGLLTVLEKSPERGRMLLKKHLGHVVMTPKVVEGEHIYEAAGGFDLGGGERLRFSRVARCRKPVERHQRWDVSKPAK